MPLRLSGHITPSPGCQLQAVKHNMLTWCYSRGRLRCLHPHRSRCPPVTGQAPGDEPHGSNPASAPNGLEVRELPFGNPRYGEVVSHGSLGKPLTRPHGSPYSFPTDQSPNASCKLLRALSCSSVALAPLPVCCPKKLFALGYTFGDAVSEGDRQHDGPLRSLERLIWFVIGHAFLGVLQGTSSA